jgi:hypothetical protein
MSTVDTPSEPTLATPNKEATWPSVIGIIAIVFGSLGLLKDGVCTPIGWAVTLLFGSFFDDLAQSQPATGMEVQAAQFDALGAFMPATVSVGCGLAVLAFLLLIGGIGLKRERPWARRAILTWAILKILITIPKATIDFLVNKAQFQAMEEAAAGSTTPTPGQLPPGMYAMMETIASVGVIFTVLWYWALPIFMIVWFARPSVRDEVRGWTGPTPAPPAA